MKEKISNIALISMWISNAVMFLLTGQDCWIFALMWWIISLMTFLIAKD